MVFNRKFLYRQKYLKHPRTITLTKTLVNVSKLGLRLCTFYQDDVISRNSPNMVEAYKKGKNLHNY
jgi:hypothetical protein